MNFDDLPDTIKVAGAILKRRRQTTPKLVYFDTPEKCPLSVHICYSLEGQDFCGALHLENQLLFSSLGGHVSRFHPERGHDCFADLPSLVRVLEKHIVRYTTALLGVSGEPHPRERYVVAAYIGYRGRMDEQQVLVEVFETYVGKELALHFRSFSIDLSMRYATGSEEESVGPVEFVATDSQPPTLVRQNLHDYWWRRIR